MLDEVARWDDLVIGLRPMTYGTKGEPVRCLVSVGPTNAAKASSEGSRLRLRPNSLQGSTGNGNSLVNLASQGHCTGVFIGTQVSTILW
jgi:hypothetical protein